VLSYPFPRPDALSPPIEFAALRKSAPLARVAMPSGGEAWLASTYASISSIMTDHHRFSRQLTTSSAAPRYTTVLPQKNTLMTLDPPTHSRLRKIVAPAFSARRIAELSPHVQKCAESLLISIREAGPIGDLVKDYATPLSTTVMCDMLGVPFEDREKFWPWADAALMNSISDPAQLEVVGWRQLRNYLAPFLAARRSNPRDDLLTRLADAQASGELTWEETLQLAATIVITGHKTTISRIASSLMFLLVHCDIMRLLVSRPGGIATAVEELLRLIPAGDGSFMNIAREDVRLPAGTIAAGDAVLTPVTAANHDPARFHDPGRFILGRPVTHSSFGFGIHRCLGAALATMELNVALAAFCRVLPAATLATDRSSLRSNPRVSVRPLEELPITW
jgi:cytochrome P450